MEFVHGVRNVIIVVLKDEEAERERRRYICVFVKGLGGQLYIDVIFTATFLKKGGCTSNLIPPTLGKHKLGQAR